MSEDGVFGKRTLQSVKTFQIRQFQLNGIPLIVDGVIGLHTWTCLFDEKIPPAIAPSPLLKAILEIARKEVGVKEIPVGSNRGARVEEYLRSVSLPGGNPWCAAFVFWCFEQASKQANCDNPLIKTGSCVQHWTRTRGIRITLQQAILNPLLITPGTIFIIGRKGGKGHTGIVTGSGNGLIQTIEGNSNAFHSAEGDGVNALERKIKDITLGFIQYF